MPDRGVYACGTCRLLMANTFSSLPLMSSTGDGRTVRAVEHAIALLRALAAASRPLALSDLARHVGLSKTSTLHLLRTLEQARFVVRDADRKYALSWGIHELGAAVARTADVTRVARPHLDALSQRVKEAVLLSILDDEAVLYLDRGYPDEALSLVANAGRRSPLHTNASGKVLLAYAEPALLDRVLDRRLAPRTTTTVVDPEAFRAEIDQVRSRGYATAWQEQEPGFSSIAAPIWDYTGRVVAALAIAGPSLRINGRSIASLLPHLTEESGLVSRSLGGGPDGPTAGPASTAVPAGPVPVFPEP